MNKPLFLSAALVSALGVRLMNRPDLRHFSPSEFGLWWPFMNEDALVALDEFRELWGDPVMVSPAVGGLGRAEGGDSQHDLLTHLSVKAVDFFPKVSLPGGGSRFIGSAQERGRARQIARVAGFTGIGLYTDTSPGNMVHGDVRNDRTAVDPEEWSRVSGRYESIEVVV